MWVCAFEKNIAEERLGRREVRDVATSYDKKKGRERGKRKSGRRKEWRKDEEAAETHRGKDAVGGKTVVRGLLVSLYGIKGRRT